MKRQPPVYQVTFTPRPERVEVPGTRWDLLLWLVGMLAILLWVALNAPGMPS